MSDTQSFNIQIQRTDQGWCAEALGQRGAATTPLMALMIWIENFRTTAELALVANPQPPTPRSAPRPEQADLLINSKPRGV